MFQLLNCFHNQLDGTYCYGTLMYEGMDYGSLGPICIYRCTMCGREIRNLENDDGSVPGLYGADDVGYNDGIGYSLGFGAGN